MNNKKKLSAIAFLSLISCMLCGAIWIKPSVSVDTEKNHVYRYITADSITDAFSGNAGEAKEQYDNQYFLIAGEFENENADGKSFTIMDQDMNSIVCKYSSNNPVRGSYSFRDKVAVYGKCNVVFGKYEITDVEKIISAPSVRSSDRYYTLDNTYLDKSSSLERTLADGKIKYYIPSAYKKTEKNIIDEQLGSIEGYQYNLNLLSKDDSNEPEVLFVCYLDKDMLREKTDIKRVNDVEKLMIQNIEDKDSITGFPLKKIKTYYGAEYQYYRGNFTTELGTGYRTEYVFQKVGEDGILMYLYLFKEEKHISDVMLITRLLETDAD